MKHSSLYKKLLNYYFKVRTWMPFWSHILNRKSRRLFEGNKPSLNPSQQKILSDLKSDGIAMSSLDDLFPGKNMLDELHNFIETLNPEESTRAKKKFLVRYWDVYPELDLSNPFLSIALSPTVLGITNSYMGMWTKLHQYELNKTIPVGEDSEAVQSQRWHRDPQEKKICKLFIYLNDVDETAGPFTYIPESHYQGRWGKLFPQKTPEGSYPSEDKVFELIPRSAVNTLTGKAGAVIFCDTVGLHRGGYATEEERLMFTAAYVAPSYAEVARYKYTKGTRSATKSLPQAAHYALQK